jgi:hypothetical protein
MHMAKAGFKERELINRDTVAAIRFALVHESIGPPYQRIKRIIGCCHGGPQRNRCIESLGLPFHARSADQSTLTIGD